MALINGDIKVKNKENQEKFTIVKEKEFLDSQEKKNNNSNVNNFDNNQIYQNPYDLGNDKLDNYLDNYIQKINGNF